MENEIERLEQIMANNNEPDENEWWNVLGENADKMEVVFEKLEKTKKRVKTPSGPEYDPETNPNICNIDVRWSTVIENIGKTRKSLA